MAPPNKGKGRAREKPKYLPAHGTLEREILEQKTQREKAKKSNNQKVEAGDKRKDVRLPDAPSPVLNRRPLSLRSNSFQMNLNAVDNVYIYDILFCPGYDPGSKRRERRLFQLMLLNYRVMNRAATGYN